MAALFLSNPALQQTLAELSKTAQPSSVADVAALGVFVLGSAGYLLKDYTWDKPDPHRHVWYERPQLKHNDASGSSSSARKETRNIAQKLDEAGKDVVVFWGSQSGTAEGFANRLARECRVRFGLQAMAADLSDFDPDTIALIPRAKLAVFIMATFGEGDPSDNAHAFWDFLHKQQHPSLPDLRYVAFGLGNSSYKHYNRVVDVVAAALDRAGASPLMGVAKADDAHGQTEEDFMAWKEELFGVFKAELGVEEHETAYEATVQADEDESLAPIDLHHGEPVQHGKTAPGTSSIRALAVTNHRELFAASDRNCIHMELDLTDHPQLVYKTGDHLAVWPTNPDDEVTRLLAILGRADRASVPIAIKSLDATQKLGVPTPTTAAALLSNYLEICAPVPRATLLSLATFAPSEEAKAYLLHLGQDRTAYADFTSRTHLTVGRILQLASNGAPWPALPLSFLIEALPPLRPRYYSLSSSSVLAPRHAAITALVANTPLPNNPTAPLIPGLTTSYLHALTQSPTNPKIHAQIRRSHFKLPALGSTPIIMAAAGTGIAPFRAFVAERARLHALRKPVARMLLFFGCRHPDQDFLYRDELAEMQRQLGGLLTVVTAFSRRGDGDGPGAGGRVYVQDRMREHSAEVARLLADEGASFYICGRASMAREVGRVVGHAMAAAKGWGEVETREWQEGFKRRGKWFEDVWG
ncbi:uncharacterized protein K452DRAFT_228793 [Aplosporella prunicola CBS 121167]|uniref:NADPH--cytochrome P450 reductase n=1 Tax=Aplosporella prunicola CBS 121167 TaxID=1176127 RepID=A0A6A6BAX2_9PEZI|nr:uncharacterized protein K452DRAFT_228793 [Aplosporella prunicola CBS 121167]KAF2141176.1 hypothetical protein K452DRAFT_228793 [Aplosporella prunicola CBS 121167]